MLLECGQYGIEFEKAKKEYTRQVKKNPERIFYCNLSCACTAGNKKTPRKGNLDNFKGKTKAANLMVYLLSDTSCAKQEIEGTNTILTLNI